MILKILLARQLLHISPIRSVQPAKRCKRSQKFDPASQGSNKNQKAQVSIIIIIYPKHPKRNASTAQNLWATPQKRMNFPICTVIAHGKSRNCIAKPKRRELQAGALSGVKRGPGSRVGPRSNHATPARRPLARRSANGGGAFRAVAFP